jgi:ATP-dependent protease ClpP protease subunit
MGRKRRAADDADDEDAGSVTSDGACVFFYAAVSRESVLKLQACLREASAAALRGAAPGAAPCVHLHIFSNGGDVFAGLAGVDHIARNRVPVVTVADGMVASAASFLLLAGARRLALPHAFVRIHQLSICGFEGKYADLVDEMQNSRALMRSIRALYRERTRLADARLDELLTKELDLDAATCVADGIVDGVLQSSRESTKEAGSEVTGDGARATGDASRVT